MANYEKSTRTEDSSNPIRPVNVYNGEIPLAKAQIGTMQGGKLNNGIGQDLLEEMYGRDYGKVIDKLAGKLAKDLGIILEE